MSSELGDGTCLQSGDKIRGTLLGMVGMKTPTNGPHRFGFGLFEADLSARELHRRGFLVHLQDQPFQVLAMLLERPGEVVTREELRKKLWSADTFVDFDEGLNTVVKKLRYALGDSPENPTFIETVPRRGYRLIVPVQAVGNHISIGKTSSAFEAPERLHRKRAASVFRIVLAASLSIFVIVLMIAVGLGPVGAWLTTPTLALRIVDSKQITNDGIPKTGALVTDGSRIYFGEFSSGRSTVKEVSTAGGDTDIVQTTVATPIVQAISPDQSQLLLQSGNFEVEGGDFWLLPLPAGSAHHIEGVFGHGGGWASTPNGRFTFGKGRDLFVANHDGSNPRKIATAPGQIGDIKFSPDSSRLRFTVYDLGKRTSSIWEVRSEGSGLRPLLPDWSYAPHECCGNWTPDGRYYFFQSVRDGVSRIWMMAEQTGVFHKAAPNPLQLTAGPLSFTYPVSSKDGKTLFAIGERRRAELVRYDPRSKDWASFLEGISADYVDFSPDGRWITYITYPDGALWRSRTDGTQRLQLTFSPVRAATARWSPNGQRIAFSALIPGKPWKISLISRDGGAAEQLTPNDTVELDPSWSPDGNELVFGAHAPEHSDQDWIESFDLKTRQPSRIPGSAGLFVSRWSPNGRYLIAIPFNAKKFLLFDYGTQKWRELISNVGTIGYFSWSPDSTYVYFTSVFTSDAAYFRLRIDASKLDRIASLKGIQLLVSDFGVPWSGLTPDQSPLFARDISTQEIYALDWQVP